MFMSLKFNCHFNSCKRQVRHGSSLMWMGDAMIFRVSPYKRVSPTLLVSPLPPIYFFILLHVVISACPNTKNAGEPPSWASGLSELHVRKSQLLVTDSSCGSCCAPFNLIQQKLSLPLHNYSLATWACASKYMVTKTQDTHMHIQTLIYTLH